MGSWMSQSIVQIYKLSLTRTLLRHKHFHIVLQVNQSKTRPLIILTEIHAKKRPRVVHGAMHSGKSGASALWLNEMHSGKK